MPPCGCCFTQERCPPAPPPAPLTHEDVARGGFSLFTTVRCNGIRLNRITFVPRSDAALVANPAAARSVDVIVVGDSWADEICMEYGTWPSLLATRSGVQSSASTSATRAPCR